VLSCESPGFSRGECQLPFEKRFDRLELLAAVAVAWSALENGAVHSVGSDQLLNLVDTSTAG